MHCPQDAGTAVALFTPISGLIGVRASIVTGSFVGAAGNFNGAFLLIGTVLQDSTLRILTVILGGIGERSLAVEIVS